MTSVIATEPTSHVTSLMDHLSFSSIKTYQSCPRKFAFRYIEKVPEEFKPATLLFGFAFHAAVERVHENRLQGLSVPPVEKLLSVFDKVWSCEASGSNVQYCKDEDETSARSLAQRMLAAYAEHAKSELSAPDGTQIISIEHSNRFRILADVPPIESRIDLLELHGTDLVVSDLKSSRSRWNDAKVHESIPQLILYATDCFPLCVNSARRES